jgi:hypothetical protein
MQNRFHSFLFCSLFLFGLPGRSSERPAASLDLDELRECRRNLQLVYEAIQAYRRVHKDIPNHLEELLPRFLSDARYLTCPAARRLGLTSLDAAKWKVVSLGTYGYEFGPEAIPTAIAGGSVRTMREWKRLQMGLVASEVPMVRCHTHERAVLNLSFGGRIYENIGIDWEPRCEDVVGLPELKPARRFASQVVLKKIVVPTRGLQALPTMIDLSDHYNCLLEETWPGLDALRPFAGLRPAVREFNGVGFDVRGAVQLAAARRGLAHYPPGISNIVIGLSGSGVHLLLGAVHSVPADTPLANCVFHLPNGRQQRLRLIYGRHLLACRISPDEEQFTPVSDAKVAWTDVIGHGQSVRLYQCEWINPSPQEVIEGMDFVVQPGNAGPFLVALTVHPAP